MAEPINLPLGRGAYKRAAAREPEVKLINRYFEDNPTNFENGVALLTRPGTELLKEIGTGRIRRTWSQSGTFDDSLFVVSGATLYRLNTDLSLEQVDGTISGEGNPEIDGTRDIVFIADGTSLQYYSGSGAAAAGTLTLTGNAGNNETVTIGTQTYTWKTALTTGGTAPNEVLIGASAAASIDNLIAAINGGSGAGTLYGSQTEINLDVVASDGAGTTMLATAKLNGTAGNAIATTETMANGSWGAATLAGGTTGKATGTLTLTGNAVNNETVTVGAVTYTWKTALTGAANEVFVGALATNSIDNLIAAINGAAGEGTTYGTGTVYNPSATAVAGAGDTMDVTARAGGSAGNTIVTTETMTNGSWGAATLAGGANATLRTIAMPDNLSVVSLGVLGGYVILVVANSDRWYYIEPGALVVDALNFYTAEAKPDELINVVIRGDQAWLFGEQTTEVWYLNGAGDPNDPFDRAEQRAFSRGVFEGTPVGISDAVMVVGDDFVVYEIVDSPRRVSTHGIEERIRLAAEALRNAGA